MNITSAAAFFANRKSTAAEAVVTAAVSTASTGMVLSIADAIANSSTIHSRKVLTSAFKKINMAAFRLTKGQPADLELDEEESTLMTLAGMALKSLAVTFITTLASVLLDTLLFVITSVVIPVFAWFCEGIAALVSLLVANPEVALLIGLTVGLGYLGWKFWQQYKQNSGEALPTPDGSTQAPKPTTATTPTTGNRVNVTSIEPGKDPKGKLAERIGYWRKKLGLADLERTYDLPEYSLSALMAQESGGRQYDVSPAGAKGLFQFMPKTAKRYGVDPFDSASAAKGAAKYLSFLYDRYNRDIGTALTAYNAGEGTVDQVIAGKRKLQQESLEYAPRILGHWQTLDPKSAPPSVNIPVSAVTAKPPEPTAAPQTSVAAATPALTPATPMVTPYSYVKHKGKLLALNQ